MYALRGCTQTLYAFGEAGVRTLSGKWIQSPHVCKKKYRSTIFCKDLYPVSLEGIWPGDILGVHCVQRFITSAVTSGERVHLHRKPVQGSFLFHTEEGEETVEDIEEDNQYVTVPQHFKTGFLSYRPLLHMVLLTFSFETHEWKRASGWKMELEEV